ncbi:MAG: prepilin-type N-terminal cleavage/methylation domain-containing protein [Verrucomicrobia bacterium]|nr:prepilin-type N-terminal cleavage/methylation domain-containing protein [Verrucomicrobiota bacterium]
MKLRPNIPAARRQSGVTLIECMVYVVVFAILLGIGTASFIFCWDHTQETIFTANEIETALRAGECWRADVRAATGKISIETTATDETLKIPSGEKEIIYRLAGGELQRETSPQTGARLLLAHVKTSGMKTGVRNGVTAWRWDLELAPRQKDIHFPLLFTFEAAQTKP